MIHFQIDLDTVKGSKPQGNNASHLARNDKVQTASHIRTQMQMPADPLESIPILE